MYSYLHRYHAGCFADVHKHLVLIDLLLSLQKKPTAFTVMDTHAGEGMYDLQCLESQKNQEYLKGIAPLLKMPAPPHLVQQLIQIIHSQDNSLENFYPGSPFIIQSFLRKEDNAICIEGHHQTFLNLKQNFAKNKRIHLHERDAFESLKALVPFKEKRGLIFIDPSYEVKDDYPKIAHALLQTYSRFSHGIYALWYPLLPQGYYRTMIDIFEKSGLKNVWHCQWVPYPNTQQGMTGSGMIVVNLPWQQDVILKETFNYLNETIFIGGHFSDHWL